MRYKQEAASRIKTIHQKLTNGELDIEDVSGREIWGLIKSLQEWDGEIGKDARKESLALGLGLMHAFSKYHINKKEEESKRRQAEWSFER